MDRRTGLPVVGMVGGGQLARMTQQAAIPLGLTLRVLSARPDDGAALVTPQTVLGEHTSYEDLAGFAAPCDVVTFDHEHVPTALVEKLAADGHTVYPSAAALIHAQDKLVMRERLAALGLPVPRWAPAADAAAVAAFGTEVGWPLVAKAARGGYDGKGVWVLDTAADADDLLAHGVPLLLEEKVPLRRELSALVARSPFGQVGAWPVVETVQRGGICVEVLAPARGLAAAGAEAQELAITLADRLGVVGVLAVELFETHTGRLLVNELAMRPHNSGHWTIEGSRTSQFEQHLRAVLDYPLGVTAMTAPAVVMANVLGGEPGGPSLDERLHHLFAADPAIRVHLYGKQVRPGRKIAHVTALGDDLDAVRERAARAARHLRDGHS
jgi:5-(carboxyamino)imidazole ribonucleotide synthase